MKQNNILLKKGEVIFYGCKKIEDNSIWKLDMEHMGKICEE